MHKSLPQALAIVATTYITAAFIMAVSAFAQGGAPIRIVVGVQPGGSTDVIARLLADKMRLTLGEPVIVENKPGATQRISMNELLKAPADGRTMQLGVSALYSIIPHIYGDKTGFDPFKDVTPIVRAASVQVGVAAGLQIKANTIAEFAAWAKANPGKVSYATPGAGGSSHFTGIMLAKALGIPMTHVPYRGSAPAVMDTVSGHIPLVISAISDLTEQAAAGKLKILGTTGLKRSPAAPQAPTLTEQGVKISFEVAYDVYAKAGTPPAAIKRLNGALVAAIKDPEVSAKFMQLGNQPVGGTPDELLKAHQAEFKLWLEPVKESGFTGN